LAKPDFIRGQLFFIKLSDISQSDFSNIGLP
jgi:hypothetical protein